jgi:hypothetical protein
MRLSRIEKENLRDELRERVPEMHDAIGYSEPISSVDARWLRTFDSILAKLEADLV